MSGVQDAPSTAPRAQGVDDLLTGLPDRALLQHRLAQAQRRLARGGTGSLVVVLLDVDDFALVNAVAGHAAGDRLLAQIAVRLRAAALPGETVARFGGDEFVVLVEGVTPVRARAVAGRVLAVLDEPFDIGGRMVHVTASVGVASSAACPPEDLLQAAAASVSVAKRRGHGGVQVFDAVLADEVRNRFDLHVELRSVLLAGGLELWYQPIVAIATGRLLGIEALARWSHPVRGFVSPDVFVPLAEQSGLVCRLDRWALRTAAADLAELRAGGHVGPDVYVSVNVSAHHLAQGDLRSAASDAVRSAGLPPGRLCLELTETVVMADPATACVLLRRMTEDGFSLALDDFGTGHSSLAYLRRLPVSTVKIDRSFVVDLAEGGVGRTICAGVVALAHALGIQTVAEGVETRVQHDLLREVGCRAGQGHHWARPMPVDVLRAWLAGSDVPAERASGA